MRILRTLSLALLSLMLSAAAFSQPLPLVKRPEDVGISSERVERIHKQLKADVDNSRVPGTVLLVVRNGKIAFYEAVGFQDRKAQKPMQKDSIFRIASMSKPITSVAIMMLSEAGKVDIG